MIDSDTMKILRHMMAHRPDLCGEEFDLHSPQHDLRQAKAAQKLKAYCEHRKIGQGLPTPIYRAARGRIALDYWRDLRSHPKVKAQQIRNNARGLPIFRMSRDNVDPRTLHWFERAS